MDHICNWLMQGMFIFIGFYSMKKLTSGETKKEKEMRKKATYYGLSQNQIIKIIQEI